MDQYMNASTWAKDRSRSIVTGLTVAAVVVAVVLIGWLLYSRRTTNAAESLASAMAVHDAIVANPLPALPPGSVGFTTGEEKHRRAFEALEKAAAEYPSYNGDLAHYLAAVHQLNFDAAKAEATKEAKAIPVRQMVLFDMRFTTFTRIYFRSANTGTTSPREASMGGSSNRMLSSPNPKFGLMTEALRLPSSWRISPPTWAPPRFLP